MHIYKVSPNNQLDENLNFLRRLVKRNFIKRRLFAYIQLPSKEMKEIYLLSLVMNCSQLTTRSARVLKQKMKDRFNRTMSRLKNNWYSNFSSIEPFEAIQMILRYIALDHIKNYKTPEFKKKAT